MFQKSIEAIIAQGVKDLEALSRQAAETVVEAGATVSRCRSEIQSLVTLSKQVPEKVFDRYSHVLTGTFRTNEASAPYMELRVGGANTSLQGLMGKQELKGGTYRVIVLLEPIS